MIVENLIKNGSFENGFTYWDTNDTANVTVEKNGDNNTHCLKFAYCATTWRYAAYTEYRQYFAGHVYYSGFSIYSNTKATMSVSINNVPTITSGYFNVGYRWERHGLLQKATENTSDRLVLYGYVNNDNAIGDYILYDDVVSVDLTEIFGAGNEPSLAWCNEHIHYSDDGVVVDYEYPSSDGPRSMSNAPLVSWIQPVTDRVVSDAVYGNSKGSLDPATLNRIEQNLTYLQQALGIAGMPAGKIPGNLLTREVLEACSDLVVTDVTVDGYTCMELGAKYYYTEAAPLDMYIDAHKLYLFEVCMRAKNDGAYATGIMLNTKDGRVWPCETMSATWQTVTFVTQAPLTTAPVVFSSNGLAYSTYYRYLCMYELNSQWRRNDYYLVGKFNQLKHDIMQIRASGLFYADTPELTDSSGGSLLGYQEMNNIERVLYDAKQLLDGMKAVQRKLGTFNAGSNYQRQYIRSV